MVRIYKYPLRLLSEQSITMPLNAQIISVKYVRGEICIYALIDTDEHETEERHFEIYGTGHAIIPEDPPVEKHFLGTVANDDQRLVYHVFENG